MFGWLRRSGPTRVRGMTVVEAKPPPNATLGPGDIGGLPPAEKGRETRSESALSLLDEETEAYILIRLVRTGEEGEMRVSGDIGTVTWPAFKKTIERISDAGSEFFPD